MNTSLVMIQTTSDLTFVHKVCKKRVSHWCVSSCAVEGPSCSWRQSCSLDTCEDEDRNAAPCEPKINRMSVTVRKDTTRLKIHKNAIEIIYESGNVLVTTVKHLLFLKR